MKRQRFFGFFIRAEGFNTPPFRTGLLIAAAVCCALGVILSGCASFGSSVGKKEWKLSEIRRDGKVMSFDRKKLETEGCGDYFTVTFNEQAAGKAAPDTYTASYRADGKDALVIQSPADAPAAQVYDPEYFPEKDYFQYLYNVKSWQINRGKLELSSSDSAGKEVVLVYVN